MNKFWSNLTKSQLFGFRKSQYTTTSYRNLKFFENQIFWLQTVGMWPTNYANYLPTFLQPLSKSINLLVYLFWQVMLFHLTCLFIKTIIDKAKAGGSLDELSGLIMSTIVYSYSFFITIYFQFRHSQFKMLLDYLQENLKDRSGHGATYFTAEDSYISARNKNLIWVWACIFSTLHVSATPLFLDKKSFPLSCDYPFDAFKSPIYEIIYFSQVLVQVQIGVVFSVSGGIFMGVVILICGQLDILFCSLKNVRFTAMLKKGEIYKIENFQNQPEKEEEEINQYYTGNEMLEDIEELKKIYQSSNFINSAPNQLQNVIDLKRDPYENELKMAMSDCIKHHQLIVKFSNLLEHVYYPYSFTKLFQIGILICFLVFLLSRATEITNQTINQLEYLALTSSELFLFCYCGETLRLQSLCISDAAMRSPWYKCGNSFRRSMQILMLNSIRPILLTAGKFYILDFERYRSVVTASFSYYTLLNTIGVEE